MRVVYVVWTQSVYVELRYDDNSALAAFVMPTEMFNAWKDGKLAPEFVERQVESAGVFE